MKKIFLAVISFVLLMENTYALSKYNINSKPINNTSDNLKVEINPILSKNNLDGVDVYLEIPEDYEEDEIIISPDIFGAISEYTYVMPGDKIKVNIHLVNNSKYKYSYIDNSFILQTDDVTRYGIEGNYKDTNAIGFDNRKIYDIFRPYRTINSAIKALFIDKKYDLTDSTLTIKLQEKGYKDINDLDKYYLDFYNNKYNLNANNLEDFNYDIIMEMFNGNMVSIKESNINIIETAYNYFYNKLLSYTFENEKVKDNNSEEYSIGSYMRNNLGNNYFKEVFNSITPGSDISLNNMSLNINGKYTVNLFMYYNFSSYMSFRLEKETEKVIDNSVKEVNNLIVPPDTGI